MMATRARLIRRDENETQPKVIIDNKVVGKSLQPQAAKKDRAMLGDIGNKADGQGIVPDKNKKPTVVYKDVRPRVDTRWKKPETGTVALKESTGLKKLVKEPVKVTVKAGVTRQISKPEVSQVKKDRVFRTNSAASVLDRAAGLLADPVLQIKNFKPSSLLRIKKDDESKYIESHSQQLLSQIDNIDEKDRSNPQLLSEYVNDIYAYLFKLEDLFPIRQNFLNTQLDVTPKMRSVLLDWINEVHFQFMLENETYHMAVSMIDRYLQSVSTTSRKQLQLVGVSALFLASKYEELLPPDIADFVYVTDDTYSKRQILDMEKQIFKALQFHLGKPLPIHFLRRFSKAAGHVGDRQYILAKYLIELASIDYGMTHYKPSEIAASSLLLALYTLNNLNNENEPSCIDDLWTPTLEYYTKYRKDHLLPIVRKLAELARTAGEAKLKAVYNKYSNSQFKFTSKLPELTGTKMLNIIKS